MLLGDSLTIITNTMDIFINEAKFSIDIEDLQMNPNLLNLNYTAYLSTAVYSEEGSIIISFTPNPLLRVHKYTSENLCFDMIKFLFSTIEKELDHPGSSMPSVLEYPFEITRETIGRIIAIRASIIMGFITHLPLLKLSNHYTLKDILYNVCKMYDDIKPYSLKLVETLSIQYNTFLKSERC